MKNSIFSVLLTMLLLSAGVTAQNELDTTFNGAGFQMTSFGTDASASDIAVQPDRKSVLVGTCANGSPNYICLARYNENGSLDTTFGGTGFIVHSAMSPSDSSYGVALQPDGKILVAGSTTTSPPGDATIRKSMAIVRYNSDGSPDASFGSGGSVKIAVGPHNFNSPRRLVLQPDGKILVAGTSTLNAGNPAQGASDAQGFIARYHADGTLDNSFGTDGFYRMTMDHRMYAQSITLQSDGKILLGGGKQFAGPLGSSMVIRLNADGSADTSWSNNGTFKVDTIENAYFVSMAVLRDGRVLGVTVNNILYRFQPNGSLDTSFNGTGTHLSALESGIPSAVLPLAGGRIMVVGRRTVNGSAYSFSRFNSDGSLDTAFSGDGRHVFKPLLSQISTATSAAVDMYGRIVVSGETDNQFVAIRLTAAPPTPVTLSGRVTRANGMPLANQTVSLSLNGASIATARTNPFGYYTFSNVMTGADYTAYIKGRGYTFPPKAFFVADDMTDLDFVESAPLTKGGSGIESIRGIIK